MVLGRHQLESLIQDGSPVASEPLLPFEVDNEPQKGAGSKEQHHASHCKQNDNRFHLPVRHFGAKQKDMMGIGLSCSGYRWKEAEGNPLLEKDNSYRA